MPSDPKVWILLILVAGIVLAIALWFGRGLKAKVGNVTVDISSKKDESRISVARNAKLEGVEAGDIAGRKSSGMSVRSSPPKAVDVLQDATVSNAKIGDIVGVKEDHNAGQQSTGATPKADANRK